LSLVAEHERRLKTRDRARRAVDQVSFEAAVSALVSDLAHQFLSDPDGSLSVSRNTAELAKPKGRYGARFIGKTFPRILDLIRRPDVELITHHEGHWHWGDWTKTTFKTVIEPGPALLEIIGRYPDLVPADFTVGAGRENIVLRHAKDLPNARLAGREKDYTDTALTLRMREEMAVINEWLAQADLSFIPGHPAAERVNLGRRTMTRIFSEGSTAFDKGGRLYHAAWIDMSKEDRAALMINGEPVVSLDFNAAFLRLAYGRAHAELPPGDPYSIGILGRWPRSIVKKLVGAMFDDKTKLKDQAAVHGLKHWPEDIRDKLKKDWPDHPGLAVVRAAIESAHAPIRHLLYRGIGLDFQNIESRIVVDLLLQLREHGVVALPVHDCIIVQRRHAAMAKDLMQRLFKLHGGIEGVVNEEQTGWPV
jgi:hypothetical protein